MQAVPVAEPEWSAAYKGLCLYMARVVQPAWEEEIVVPLSPGSNALKANIPHSMLTVRHALPSRQTAKALAKCDRPKDAYWLAEKLLSHTQMLIDYPELQQHVSMSLALIHQAQVLVSQYVVMNADARGQTQITGALPKRVSRTTAAGCEVLPPPGATVMCTAGGTQTAAQAPEGTLRQSARSWLRRQSWKIRGDPQHMRPCGLRLAESGDESCL